MMVWHVRGEELESLLTPAPCGGAASLTETGEGWPTVLYNLGKRTLKSRLGISTVTLWAGRSLGRARGVFTAGCLLRSPTAAEDAWRRQKSAGRGAARVPHGRGLVCIGGFAIAQHPSPKEERGRKWRTGDDGVADLAMPCYS